MQPCPCRPTCLFLFIPSLIVPVVVQILFLNPPSHKIFACTNSLTKSNHCLVPQPSSLQYVTKLNNCFSIINSSTFTIFSCISSFQPYMLFAWTELNLSDRGCEFPGPITSAVKGEMGSMGYCNIVDSNDLLLLQFPAGKVSCGAF